MFGQTFSVNDLFPLFSLIILETILSVDNALVLSTIAQKLPSNQRKKALFIGLISAFIFRLFGILFIGYFFDSLWIKLIGGLYLLYLSFSYFFFRRKKGKPPPPPQNFFKTVVKIECLDLIFSIDSMVIGVSFVSISFTGHHPFPPDLWIVYVAGAIGLLLVRFGALFLIHLIEKFPFLEKAAHIFIGWIGFKLILETIFLLPPCLFSFLCFFVMCQ